MAEVDQSCGLQLPAVSKPRSLSLALLAQDNKAVVVVGDVFGCFAF